MPLCASDSLHVCFNLIFCILILYRKQLQKAIPGLRPWEVLSVEQAMDQITYNGQWYREPLGTFTTGPPYIRDWNDDVEVSIWLNLQFLIYDLCVVLSIGPSRSVLHTLCSFLIFSLSYLTR